MKINLITIVAVLMLTCTAWAEPTKPTSDAYLRAEARMEATILRAQDVYDKKVERYTRQYLSALENAAKRTMDVDDLQKMKLEIEQLKSNLASHEDEADDQNKESNPETNGQEPGLPPEFKNVLAQRAQERFNTLLNKAGDVLVRQKVSALKTFKKSLDSARLEALRDDDIDEAVALKREQANVDKQITALTGSDTKWSKQISVLFEGTWIVSTHKQTRAKGKPWKFSKNGTVTTPAENDLKFKVISDSVISVEFPGGWVDTLTYDSPTLWNVHGVGKNGRVSKWQLVRKK